MVDGAPIVQHQRTLPASLELGRKEYHGHQDAHTQFKASNAEPTLPLLNTSGAGEKKPKPTVTSPTQSTGISRRGSDGTVVAWQGGRVMRRRSSVVIAPIGSPVSGWGKHETLAEIMARPPPAPPVHQGQNKTMAMHGGRWSLYKPATQLYWESRRSMQTPGPGAYGDPVPDAALSNAPAPFGKLSYGHFSRSERRTDVDIKMSHSRKIPGPGQYDTEHTYGMYQRIKAAIPETGSPSRPHTRIGLSTASSPVSMHGEESGFSWDPIGDSSIIMDPIAAEQCLVMSMKVPVQKHQRLGVTWYSRLRKDKIAPPVRKIYNRSPIRSPSPFAKPPPAEVEHIDDEDDESFPLVSRIHVDAGGDAATIPHFKREGTVMI